MTALWEVWDATVIFYHFIETYRSNVFNLSFSRINDLDNAKCLLEVTNFFFFHKKHFFFPKSTIFVQGNVINKLYFSTVFLMGNLCYKDQIESCASHLIVFVDIGRITVAESGLFLKLEFASFTDLESVVILLREAGRD